MDYENLTDSALFKELREQFPKATLKRITEHNRPIVIMLLKAFEEKKGRDGQCTAPRSEKT